MEQVLFNVTEVNEKINFDTIHINQNKKLITGYINVYRFIDKDTKQIVVYAPSFDVSGYGQTKEKATIMVKESLSALFISLLKMSPTQLNLELSKLGWKKNRLRNKDFSNPAVNIQGKLKDLNADKNQIERFALVA